MFDWLKQRIIDTVKWIADLWVSIFKAAWDLLTDALTWIVDQMLGIAVSAANSLDVSGLQAYTASWGSLPGEIANVMGLLGAGTASAIILAAVAIRLVLQLIPFTRLGS